jgi:hypothetical protein
MRFGPCDLSLNDRTAPAIFPYQRVSCKSIKQVGQRHYVACRRKSSIHYSVLFDAFRKEVLSLNQGLSGAGHH